MRRTKAILWVFAWVLFCLVSVPVARAGLTVLVVPARYSVLQVGFDVANRYGTVLVSYQGEVTSDSPLLYCWNGAEWMGLSIDDYAQARYLRSMPETIIVVGGDDMLPPVLVSRVSSWCSDVRVIPSVDTPGLVNALGETFSFTPHDWQWFARRYNLQLQDGNEEQRRQSWYDRSSYEDEWSDRWKWLRRKYNEPKSPESEQAPVTPREQSATPRTYLDQTVTHRASSMDDSFDAIEEDLYIEQAEDMVIIEEEIEVYPIK